MILAWSLLNVLINATGIVLAFVVACFLLRIWISRRPHVPSRHCQWCQYDLNHNTTGRCPECGKVIPTKQQAFLERENE